MCSYLDTAGSFKTRKAAAPIPVTWITSCGFAGYYPTSAKTARGIDPLRAIVAKALNWDNLAKTTRPVLFQRVRDEIDQRRSKGEVVLLYDDLDKQLRLENAENYEPEAVRTVVRQLTVQGVIAETRLTTGQRVLVLQIGEIERYAGSLIFAARNNTRGIPALEERDITASRFTFPGIKAVERLHPFQERIVLEAVIQLLIEHGICFKREGLLIFLLLFSTAPARETAAVGESVRCTTTFPGRMGSCAWRDSSLFTVPFPSV